MKLTGKMQWELSAPDLAAIEAEVESRAAPIRAQLAQVEGYLNEQLAELGASSAEERAAVAEIRRLRRRSQVDDEALELHRGRLSGAINRMRQRVDSLADENPKLVDGEIRRKRATIRRLKRNLAALEGAVEAAKRVSDKPAGSMITVDQRPWGRSNSKLTAHIDDPDLQLLRKLKLIEL